jgi:hypothetical protein
MGTIEMSVPMSEQAFQRELAIYRYVAALDAGDLEGVEAVLHAAIADPELAEAVAEINLSYQEELLLAPPAEDAAFVRELLRKHFHSAFADEEPAEEPAEEPLTVSDVAIRLEHEQRVSGSDREANRCLLGIRLPVPEMLSLQAVEELARQTGVEASGRFWRQFRETAIMLGIGRSHQQSQLAAAREARRRKRPSRGESAPREAEGGQE